MLADRLRAALPALPPQLAAAGRHVSERPFDAATRSMRALAAEAGASPATFTRLAQALGFAGWDELRAAAIEEQRRPAPYSSRAGDGGLAAIQAAEAANIAALATLPEAALQAAAAMLDAAPRIHVAGFRSCRAVATLLHYQLRLFRPETVLVGDAALDLDLGAMQRGEALVLTGFAPYSRAALTTQAAARAAGLRLVVLADSPAAPVAAGAEHLLVFATATPAFFPSLTAALALAQALAAAVFALGGEAARARLRESEARLATLSAYLPEPEDQP
ncbi:MurR/RpiR family transcriptional regulator [Belnapia rosea]|uniref:Transcriptional regulator, RpiR family n=1 Tax=Belnapia rosea TaxID=938405 RepID=A0A1G6SP61_9PROT|nr:SIS domain-containing protein [Belnapia rosea]SDD17915.1 transcriptional regulator, RpiR family [Belnapia rosea]